MTRSHLSASGIDSDAECRTPLAIDIGSTNAAITVGRNGRVDSVRLVTAVLGVSGDGVVVGESARAHVEGASWGTSKLVV